MERPIFQPIGSPIEHLDTPALVIDLPTMENNLEIVHSFFRSSSAKARPHIEAHKCPTIAHKQLAAGGTVGGICTAKVGEAEVFAQTGFTDILVANEIVTRPKIDRLCALAHHVKVTVAVDNPKNIHDLSQAAQAHGVTLNVLVDINTRLNRCGVDPGQPAVELAQEVTRSPSLHFAGLMVYEGSIREKEYDALVRESKNSIQPVLDTRQMVEQAGIPVEVVSVGGTHNYEIAGTMDGVTEVQVGSYVLMDANYCQYRKQFKPAAKIMATVVSRPTNDKAIANVGQKVISRDLGLPVLENNPGATVYSLSAEHARIRLAGEAQHKLDVLSTLWFVPWDLETCVNSHNYINVARNGKLEAIWEVAARGRYD